MTIPVLADNWTAIKLRGAVYTLVNDSWVQLARGDVVPDDRIIRTAPNARVQFARGKETIDLGPDTQIRIFDRDGQRFTIVQQHFGDVAIEAERLNVQHFVVQTRYLAAVVKGTRFSVSANASSAKVTVARGQVEVRDVARKVMTEVMPGQSASVGNAEMLTVSGNGPHAPIVPYTGEPLAPEVAVAAADSAGDASPIAASSPTSATTTSTTSGTVPVSTTSTTTTTAPTTATVPAGATTTPTSTTVATPAVSVTANTPAASVVATTPAATSTPSSTTVTTTSTGTPAISNTADTPAASVVANTPAATKTMPSTSNAGGKK